VPGTGIAARYNGALRLELRGELARARAYSPTHALVATAGERGLVLAVQCEFAPDRDLDVLVEEPVGAARAVLAQDEKAFVSLASFTVRPLEVGMKEPRALKLVVDCSASMAGASIDQAREAIQRCCARSAPGTTSA
jgi:hypothetical protein